MQKIKLNTILYYQGKYIIYLDAQTRLSFTNKRKAQDFLRTISARIDKAHLFITEAYSDLSEFYNLYNLADDDYKFKFEVKSSLDFISNRLAWISERRRGENSQALTIQAVHGCYSELIQAFSLIHDKAAQRNDHLLKRRCSLRMELTEMYSETLLILSESTNQLKLKAV